MNPAHRWLSNSRIWRSILETHIVPWTIKGVDFRGKVLELGPGPGFTTASLRASTPHLTCIEIDTAYASSLAHRMTGDGIRVLAGDASAMPLADASFDAVVCFTMLHHVPSTVLQDRLLGEVLRVLRPGGRFVGSDLLGHRLFRLFHILERVAPVDPTALPERLRASGFEDIRVDVGQHAFRFQAYKPG